MRKSNEYTKDVRNVILSSGISRVYERRAPETKEFPYAVYDIRALTEARYVIEVDLWGLKGNENELADMADGLEAVMAGYIIANDNHSSMISSNNDMKWVDDSDENLIRINMSFNSTYQG